MDWNTSLQLLSTALGSSSSLSIVNSILIKGKPGVGKHSLVRAAIEEANNNRNRNTKLILSSGEDLSDILSNPSKKIADKSSRFPFSSTIYSTSSTTTDTKNNNNNNTRTVILWEDLHLAIGGYSNFTTDSDFAADVVESICKCLMTDLPKNHGSDNNNNNIIIIALFDDVNTNNSNSNSNENNNLTSFNNNNNNNQKAILQILHRVFDLVIDVVVENNTSTESTTNRIRKEQNEEKENEKNIETSSSPWDMIVGHDDIKKILQDMINNNNNNTNSSSSTTGILMTGVAGTGKTLLARALSESLRKSSSSNKIRRQQQQQQQQQQSNNDDSSSSSFFSLNASSIISAEVGVSERRLVDLFEQARRNAPSVIFIDEAQAIFRKREGGDNNSDSTNSSGSSSGDRRLLTTFLRLLDSNRQRNVLLGNENTPTTDVDSRIIVVAATNVPRMLDPSLLRYGRLSTIVHVGPPSLREVQAIVRDKWLKERHGIFFGGDDATTTSNHNNNMANWILNVGIVNWATPSTMRGSSKENKSNSTTNNNIPTGADVTGLLNLIDLRLASATTTTVSTSSSRNSTSSSSVRDFLLNATSSNPENVQLIQEVLDRVKPSVSMEALREVRDFEV